jgi:hypothetical protein
LRDEEDKKAMGRNLMAAVAVQANIEEVVDTMAGYVLEDDQTDHCVFTNSKAILKACRYQSAW